MKVRSRQSSLVPVIPAQSVFSSCAAQPVPDVITSVRSLFIIKDVSLLTACSPSRFSLSIITSSSELTHLLIILALQYFPPLPYGIQAFARLIMSGPVYVEPIQSAPQSASFSLSSSRWSFCVANSNTSGIILLPLL